MADLNDVDVNDVAPSEGYDLLPPGDYRAMITGSEKRRAASGNDYLSIEYTITGPWHVGRKLWSNFNLWHENSKAVEIARREFRALLDAVSYAGTPRQSEELHDRHLTIRVVQKPRRDTGEMGNRISRFIGDGAAPAAGPAGAPAAARPPTPAAAAAAGAPPPWARK